MSNSTPAAPASGSQDPEISPEVIAEFTPTGRMRVMINLGNPVLAGVDPASHRPIGVSVDLAKRFAARLGVEFELLPVNNASQSVEAVTRETADIGFFAIDPVRGAGINFTAPYVLIEGSYLVSADSPLENNEEVDRAGCRLVVGRGSAYDLYLSREIRHATIIRAESSQTVVATFLDQSLDVAAGVRQQLEADSKQHPGLRILPGGFMVIKQAMGLPKARSAAAAKVLHAFVEDMKASGFVQQALARHRIEGAGVAPPESAR